MPSFTMTADGNYLLNATPGVSSEDGLALSFTITGTNSGVLAVNTAPPGAALSLSDVAYLNGSLIAQSAGTAITATGLAYVSAETASRGDLYLVLNWTSGTVVVTVAPSSLGGSGSGAPGGAIPAGDVTAGTFGANSGEVGDYAVPDDFTVADVLTAASATVTGAIGTNTLSLSGAASPAVAGLLVSNTVTAVSAAARGQRIASSLVAGANADVLYGLDVAPTLTPGAFTGLSAAAVRVANNSTAMTGTKYGIFVGAPSGATTNHAILSQGNIVSDSPTAGIGYVTGAGGAQTQATNKQTTVVSNTITTAITMNAENLGLSATTSFTFTNSTIAATDTVLVTHQSAGTGGAYTFAAFPGAGSAVIYVRNVTLGNLSEAIVIRVTVIKSVSA